MYAKLFSTTCPIGVLDGEIVGCVIAFRSQDDPAKIDLQDVMTHPRPPASGVTGALVDEVRWQGSRWGCQRLYLTLEPANRAAHAAWLALGFVNVEGDRLVDGVSVISNYKGPGKHRAVYECHIGS
ncbi:GNAT family N-acetyltransferase [Micromonospora sp. NPDC047670]|uniref:GNAT family N-acetyltransferase n=1 Tax=Micromonospora sp. NPDC047670 TaxID=3364252 RepID=UPI003713AF20